jgi:hypothetical protein
MEASSMKTAALIMFCITAAAHAQVVRPVQHTNGTVVSPTNFWSKASIQISNVAGLQAELNSKLSSVSSWSISNVTGLQAALDSKLATNGSLPIGNVSGFSAIGLTFATNTNPAVIRQTAGLVLQALTNQTATDFRSAIGLSASWLTNTSPAQVQVDLFTTNRAIYTGTQFLYAPVASWASGTWVLSMPLDVTDPAGPGLPSYKAITRSNLGLGATWLTNGSAPLFWTAVPSATNSSGFAGQVAYTNNYLYICVASNTWRRVQLGAW